MKYEEFQYDDSDSLIDAVTFARATHTGLLIRGGNTKAFLGRACPKGAAAIGGLCAMSQLSSS
jgi:hypothetical protein